MIDINSIKSFPLITNKIRVEVNIQEFFSLYSVVSYYSFDKQFKNLAYEQLADVPCLSVTGLRARWGELSFPTVKFFILVQREKVSEVQNSLKKFDKIRFQNDDLSDYKDSLKEENYCISCYQFIRKSKKQ